VVIIDQPYQDVGMEYFMDDYFSVEKFKKAYARLVESFVDRGSWPKVPFAAEVGALILKRAVGRQRNNRMKGCLEGGSSKKLSGNETEKAKKIVASSSVQIINSWAIEKNSPKCPFNGTKKASFFTFVMGCPLCLYCCVVKSHIANSFTVVQEKEGKEKYYQWLVTKRSSYTN
jgi:hypothetical protein